jgi:hypothetical protein
MPRVCATPGCTLRDGHELAHSFELSLLTPRPYSRREAVINPKEITPHKRDREEKTALPGKSEYEIERDRNILANNEALDIILGSSWSRRKELSAEEAAAAELQREARKAERLEKLTLAQSCRRLSSRLASRPAKTHSAEAGAASRRVEFEERWDRPEPPRTSVSRGRRFSRNAVKDAVELTPAERASLGAAQNWVEEIEAWLRPTHSDDNMRTVMRVVRRLAAGVGVDTGPSNGNRVFLPSAPVDMATDLVALRAEANAFLPPENDPGHGWRLNHPIGKMLLFQRSLLQERRAG